MTHTAQDGPVTASHVRQHKDVTRKGFLKRGAAAISGLLASRLIPGSLETAYGQAGAGYNNCLYVRYYTICTTGTTSTCTVGYGFPSCTDSHVTRYSPNQKYELTCHCYCPAGTCRCTPTYFQARVAVKNGGTCGCTCV